MESSATVSGVSFGKKPRRGQTQIFEHPGILKPQGRLSIKLPTGYGKTFTAAGVYSIRQHHGLASRLLYIVPRDAQLDQFVQDGPNELALTGTQGPLRIFDIRKSPLHKLLREHHQNTTQVFAITVQSLCEKRGLDVCQNLMTSGTWMIGIDEYHHYGIEKTWGRTLNALTHSFLLAMSATPYRPAEDSAFGKPDIVITYREAVDEGCLKPLHGHAYHYRIDAIDEDGNLTSYTTEELAAAAGSENPEDIEKFRIERKMRWSPKYVSPLVRVPIERMETGCQALISAMCVSHAELVCSQLQSMYPELRIDWVGTGDNGRSDEENRAILKRFCPPKNQFGVREPTLDVLVHVGICGEGLDCIQVSEVVFLRPASPSNRDNQTIGRGSRLFGTRKITTHVSFDASTKLVKAGYIGSSIIDAIDNLPPKEKTPPDSEPDYPAPPDLPIEPDIQIFELELTGIDSGDAGVQRLAEVLAAFRASGNLKQAIDIDALKADANHPDWNLVIEAYKKMRAREAAQFNEQSTTQQWHDAVTQATRNVTGLILSMMHRNGTRIEKTLIGDIKKRLNTRKKGACGGIENTLEACKLHYDWLQMLSRELRTTNKLPGWLQ